MDKEIRQGPAQPAHHTGCDPGAFEKEEHRDADGPQGLYRDGAALPV